MTEHSENSLLITKVKLCKIENIILESGKQLRDVTIAYETYGTLNEKKNNAVLITHGFSGDAHAAGFHEHEAKPGWWSNMIGHGKAFDTSKYFVICSNVLGGCAGSTGPSSLNPTSNKPYALDFPIITISDMVHCQKKLIDFLKIDKLLAVVGGSMGGMQVLQWAISYPEKICSAIPIATTMKHSPQQIAFNEVGRQAIMADIGWKNGNYYDQSQPDRGLAIARMIGHITYMSDKFMQEKFSRNLKDKDRTFKFTPDFEVEGYLKYRGDTFVKRFDANSYLYITKAMDYFDVSGNNFLPNAKHKDIKFLVMSFSSDWLYPSYQSENIVKQLTLRGYNTTYVEIKSTYGHDSFLVEVKDQTKLIIHFLEKVLKEALS
ncbi:homoserine O-acetyltransferase [Candidatus Endomicrobiellum devescovinae]|uniref:homoserine O-acetyltransferase MetX n=1 Tax=Candidatus Endomicrobiellum devescovinae TaxID=3242322 RepID=UPI0028336560|nr:homoserine O-acetyltransferase [Endomicrobium sp.]